MLRKIALDTWQTNLARYSAEYKAAALAAVVSEDVEGVTVDEDSEAWQRRASLLPSAKAIAALRINREAKPASAPMPARKAPCNCSRAKRKV